MNLFPMLHVTPLKTPEKQNFFDFFSRTKREHQEKMGQGSEDKNNFNATLRYLFSKRFRNNSCASVLHQLVTPFFRNKLKWNDYKLLIENSNYAIVSPSKMHDYSEQKVKGSVKKTKKQNEIQPLK